MAAKRDPMLVAVLVGGAGYLLWRYTAPAAGAGGFWDVGPAGTSSPFLAPGRSPTGAPVAPGFPGAAQTLTGAAASGFAAAGPIGAAAATVAAGVAALGWGRGGEEGIAVNPARDQFLAQYATLDPTRDGRNPPGFYGLHWLLRNVNAQTGQALFDALLKADTMAEFSVAVSDVQAFLQTNAPAVTYYAGGGYDAGLKALYLKYYNREPDAGEYAAHRGNPGGLSAVEQLLIASLK